jgi:hypothetical protein
MAGNLRLGLRTPFSRICGTIAPSDFLPETNVQDARKCPGSGLLQMVSRAIQIHGGLCKHCRPSLWRSLPVAALGAPLSKADIGSVGDLFFEFPKMDTGLVG